MLACLRRLLSYPARRLREQTERKVAFELARRELERRQRQAGEPYHPQALYLSQLLGLHPQDLVVWETVSEFGSQLEMVNAVLAGEVPVRAHRQWCARALGRGECDCAAEWELYGQGGEPLRMSPRD